MEGGECPGGGQGKGAGWGFLKDPMARVLAVRVRRGTANLLFP